MWSAKLDYEPQTSARPVVVEHEENVTRVIVPMHGPYAPVPQWVGHLEFFALIIWPIWWIGSLLVRSFLRLPKPPRATFVVAADQFLMTLRDQVSGETNSFRWPRVDGMEARGNRYERGLWINIPGHVKDTFLQDMSRETIERLETELRAALDAYAPTM